MTQHEFLNQILSESSSPPPLKDFISLDAISQALQDRLEISNLKIETHQKYKRSPEEVLESFGSDPVVFCLSSLSVKGLFYWIMHPSEMQTFSSWTFTKDDSAEKFHDTKLLEGYFTYLFLQTMSVLKTLTPFSKLQFQMIDTKEITEDCQCIDLQFFSHQNQCQGRLAISQTAFEAFKKELFLFKDYAKSSASIPLKVIAGTVLLTHEQKNQIQPGDFIVLDSVQYDPKTHQGTMDIYFETHPIFKVLLKQKKLKLLEFHSHKKPENKSSHEIQAVIAKMTLPAHKLYSLKPEDSLEIILNPHQILSLVEKNKTFAHAELLHIGEVIGVRVLEIVSSL